MDEIAQVGMKVATTHNTQGTIFIVSTASCGDVRAELIRAHNHYDIMRHFLLKSHPNEYYCSEFKLEKTRRNALLAAVMRARYADQPGRNGCSAGYNGFTIPNNSLGNLEIFLQYPEVDIIANLSDRDVELAFQYMYTGGYGEQSGIPGKEWNTVEITRMNMGNIQVVEPLRTDPRCGHYDNTHYVLASTKLRKFMRRKELLEKLVRDTSGYKQWVGTDECEENSSEEYSDKSNNDKSNNDMTNNDNNTTRPLAVPAGITDLVIRKVVEAQIALEKVTYEVSELEYIARMYLECTSSHVNTRRYITVYCCMDECDNADIAPDVVRIDEATDIYVPEPEHTFTVCYLCSCMVCEHHTVMKRIPNVRVLQNVCYTCAKLK